jgi:hypothetical protein
MNRTLFRSVGSKKEANAMRNPIEHWENQIARLRAEIERRKAVGLDNDEHQRRLKTLEALRDVHATENTYGGRALAPLPLKD